MRDVHGGDALSMSAAGAMCVWPGRNGTVRARKSAVWPNDGFRGYSCAAYPGCSEFAQGTKLLACDCNTSVLKLAHPSAVSECALGDQHRALLKTRDFRCFEKLAGRRTPGDAGTQVVAHRMLRVLKVPQSYIFAGGVFGQRPTASPSVCTDAYHILRQGEQYLAGHDASASNFIFPTTSETWNHLPPYSRCPFVVIDLAEFKWSSTGGGAKRKATKWFGSLEDVNLAWPWTMPNCHVVKPAFPCNIWKGNCPGSQAHAQNALLHRNCSRTKSPNGCEWIKKTAAKYLSTAMHTHHSI